jgi:hypothetical protein
MTQMFASLTIFAPKTLRPKVHKEVKGGPSILGAANTF